MTLNTCQNIDCLKESSRLYRFYMRATLFILVCKPCFGKLCYKKLVENRPAFLRDGVE